MLPFAPILIPHSIVHLLGVRKGMITVAIACVAGMGTLLYLQQSTGSVN